MSSTNVLLPFLQDKGLWLTGFSDATLTPSERIVFLHQEFMFRVELTAFSAKKFKDSEYNDLMLSCYESLEQYYGEACKFDLSLPETFGTEDDDWIAYEQIANYYCSYFMLLLVTNKFVACHDAIKTLRSFKPNVWVNTLDLFECALCLQQKDTAAAWRLLDQNKDEQGTAWNYTRALCALLDGSADLEAYLVAAYRSNRHVTEYIVGEKKLGHIRSIKAPLVIGSASEAKRYLKMEGISWFYLEEPKRALAEWYKNKPKKVKARQPKRVKPPKFGGDMISAAEFEEYLEELTQLDFKNRARTLGTLARFAEIIFAKKPWELFGEQPIVIIFSAELPHATAHFSGQLGDLLGCHVYRSFEHMQLILDNCTTESGVGSQAELIDVGLLGFMSETISIALTDRNEVTQPDKNLLDAAFKPKRQMLPNFECKKRGHILSRCTNLELFYSALGLIGLGVMCLDGVPDNVSVWSIDLSGAQFKILHGWLDNLLQQDSFGISKASVDMLPGFDPAVNSQLSNIKDDIRNKLLMAQPRGVWQLGFATIPMAVKNSPGQPGMMTLVAAVVDKNSGAVLAHQLISGNQSHLYAAGKALKAAISKHAAKPVALEIKYGMLAESTFDWLQDLASDVQVTVVDSAEMLEEFLISMINFDETSLNELKHIH